MRVRKQKADLPLAERRSERDAENRIIVNMTVKDDRHFLSVFSVNDTPVISTDVAEFIEASTHAIPPHQQLTLRIHSDCVDAQEQLIYEKAIREYYSERYLANERELRRNHAASAALAVAGVVVLTLAILLEYRANSVIFSEVMDIVAWVLLWEAVDIRVFVNRSLKTRRAHYRSYLSMKLEYYPLASSH